MTYIIAEPCVDVLDRACIDVCPVDCIYEAEEHSMLLINPEECIDCAACEPVCPVAAIFAEDVAFETKPWSGGEQSGRDYVIKAFKSYQRRFGNRKRFIVNELINITGPHSATAWSNWLVLHANEGDSYAGWGSYDWECRRVAGEWLFSKMIITVDCMTTLEKGWGDAASLVAQFPERKAR